MRRPARCGSGPRPTGQPCTVIRGRTSTDRWPSRRPTWRRVSPGVRRRRWSRPLMDTFRCWKARPVTPSAIAGGGQPLAGAAQHKIFIGSCTNARIEDLREAAGVLRGRRVHARIKQALVVPGSGLVKLQAEREGLDQLFLDAGFEWRAPGCSMCLGMNPDRLQPGERCASTSNRNFEGRQGLGGRTHLMSPAMAVAASASDWSRPV